MITYTRRFIHVNPNTVNVNAILGIVEQLELIRPETIVQQSVAYLVAPADVLTHSWVSGWNQSADHVMSVSGLNGQLLPTHRGRRLLLDHRHEMSNKLHTSMEIAIDVPGQTTPSR